jgi:broad specificity phosphatase PhoE
VLLKVYLSQRVLQGVMEMARTWILMRHPHKEGDDEGIYLGDTASITSRGEAEMHWVIERLKHLCPEAVTCSMFPRAVALAEHIASELGREADIIKHGLLNEVSKPRFLIGMKRTDPVHIEVMQSIRDQFDDDTVPTHLLRGEKIQTRSELESTIRRLFHFIENIRTADVVLSVSHAKLIAAILHYVYRGDGTLLGYYTMADRALKLSTTGISILTFEPNRRSGKQEWHIKTINEEAHVDSADFTSLRSILDKI